MREFVSVQSISYRYRIFALDCLSPLGFSSLSLALSRARSLARSRFISLSLIFFLSFSLLFSFSLSLSFLLSLSHMLLSCTILSLNTKLILYLSPRHDLFHLFCAGVIFLLANVSSVFVFLHLCHSVSHALSLSLWISVTLCLCALCWWAVVVVVVVVVLSLHAPARWICVLWGCVRREATGKLMEYYWLA